MIKKVLLVAVFFAIITAISQQKLSVEAKKITFKDVPEDDWAATYIDTLVNDSLISGYPDSTFRPNQPISRAEAISLLVKNKGLDVSLVHGKERFKDVKSNFWAYPAIATAAQKGWVSGYSDGTYRPNQPVTRAESAVLLMKIYEIKEKDTSFKFKDVSSAFWAYHGIKALVDNSIASGDNLQRFSPNKKITRAEFSALLVRTIHPELRSNEDGNQESNPIKNESGVYILELSKWNVYNNGTHPVETTKGFNNALKWAHEKGYSTFKVPAGTYLIAKGNGCTDKSAQIQMVSDMTLLLDKDAIIKKETNGFEGYSVIELGPDVKNVTIKGGTLIGDRDTHDYSQKCGDTAGTHEWGAGVVTKGPQNVIIKDVSIKNFTGDGVEIAGSTIFGTKITEKDLESGGIDVQGKPIAEKGKIRSNNYDVTNFRNKIYQNPHYRNLMMWLPEGVTGSYDLYYYKKDGTFIRKDKDQHFQSTHGYSSIPSDADYFRVVFNASSTKGVSVSRFAVAVTKNITIKNCDIGFNRRQAITVGASDGVQILNNRLHDTGGTAPGSGIDVEPGFFPAKNIHIKGNTFTNNKIQTVLSYGANVTIDDNVYGESGKGSVGLYIWAAFQGVTIKNNKFENGPGLYVNTSSTITNNTFINSGADFKGKGIRVDGIEATDSKIKFDSTAPFGIKGSNITMKMTGTKEAGLWLNGEPLQLSHVKLTGPSTTHPIGTFGSYTLKSGSIFDHISVEGSIYGYVLPPGTYNDCQFIAASGHMYGAQISKPGAYNFNHCTFKAAKTNLNINNPDADVTIKESTFEELDPDSYSLGIIEVSAAKNITLLNNSIDAKKNADKSFQPIKIGKFRGNQYPSQVKAATIKGNVIYSSILVNGISTVDAGTGAPAYHVENNTLYNAKMYLKAGDINKNNKELITK